ncbi:hypothetical protein ACEPAH_4853 [Sanghuangporus vaninii]
MPSSASWDPTRAKAQIRLAAQRLGQLQDRKDSLAHITSKDIATLLGQRNVSLARTKAQNLMNEDAVSNAMEVLEMYCALVLERFSELEKDELKLNPSMVEAVPTIIYAAPFTECQELLVVRGILMDRLGPDFSQSALYNSDGHVSQRIIRLMHASLSADDIDAYLFNIARRFGVDWKPRMKTEQKLAILSEMLDASDIMGTVDLVKLREIASSGIPVDPSWLRPRVWKLLLGITPLMKAQWESESRKKREGYYDLIRRLLVNIAELPPPSTPLSPPDKSLLALVESLSRVPAHLFRGLEDEIEQSPACPLHEFASPDIKIGCASALDERLQFVQDQSPKDNDDESFSSTPEIRLDSGSAPTSPQEKTSFTLSEVAQGASQQQSKTLSISSALSPKVFRSIPAHPFHISALLRLLYIHKSLNPGSESPHLASLLVPLYTVMNQEAEPAEAAHAEADTFWLFEVLIREVSELDETEGGLVWMKKFRERASMADHELLEDLTLKGLDPGLPQYSYRWLAPVLSHTLPLPAVLMAWDALFAQADMTRQSNPRLEHLLDICTAMLVRARAQLLLLGKGGRKSPSLWDVEPSGVARQTLRPWELGDAFMEGMTLLQNYPIENAGGMERILQVAGDILIQREQLTKPPQNQNPGLGAMIRDKVWRGITNQSAVEVENNSPEDSDEETEDETETEIENDRARSNTVTQSSANNSGWSSFLKTTVIRGITNESAMDPESPRTSPLPSPTRPSHNLSPAAPSSPLPEEKPSSLVVPSAGSGLWGYAEKLRRSDMAAKLAKASTNLSAKALDAWTSRNAVVHGASTSEKQQVAINPETSLPRLGNGRNGIRHGSMPNIHHPEPYSPPPRPAFFKPPRDTRIFSSDEINSLKIPDSPESGNSSLSASTLSAGGHTRAGSLASVLPSWASGQSRSSSKSPKPTKSAPKPLLLSASSLVTAGSVSHVSRSVNSTPTPRNLDWSDVRSSKVLPSSRRHDSEFSETSVSPRTSNHSASPKTALSGWDSDQSVSRVVRLNRQSISPMAPAFRINRSSSRNPSVSSQSEFGALHYKTASEYRSASEGSPRATNGRIVEDFTRGTRSWDRISPDSPSTLPSSPPPRTPVSNSGLVQSSIRVANAERQRGSLVLSESGFSGLDAPPQGKRASRKPSSPTVVAAGDTSDSSIPSASPLSRNTPRVRTKRLNGTKVRPPSLRTRSPEGRGASISMPGQSPSSLAAPDLDSELDMATTPRAQQFPSTSPTDAQAPRSPRRRKISMEGPERRRKMSGETNGTRTRKISTESRSTRTRKISDSRRDSHANDGDDEGYDELLSAYESEASDSKYECAASSEA